MTRFAKLLIALLSLCALSMPAALVASPPQHSISPAEDTDWLDEDDGDDDDDDDDDDDFETEYEDENDDDDD